MDGSGANQISTGGTAGGSATNVYLTGSGKNNVTTGAGATNVYDRGAGGNTVTGGTGGGTDYYGENGSGAAYANKGGSSLSTAYGNFAAVVSGYSTYQLSDYGVAAGSYSLGLSGVASVILNATSASATNSFTLANWSGNATLNGLGTNNTLNNLPGPSVSGVNDVLTNSSLQVTGGVTQTISLNNIQAANLVGSANGANTYTVSAWTGTGSVTGQGTSNSLTATNDVANFFLSDTLLQRAGDGDLTLSSVPIVNLNGGPSANAFTVGSWSGIANLDGKDGSDTYNLTLGGSGTGVVNVADSGTTGTDTLNVTAARTTLVTSTSVRVGTQRANYGSSGIEVLNIIGNSGGLTFNVQSTSTHVSTTVQTTGNSNIINVASTAGVLPHAAGVLNQILGALNITGGGQDTANIDDSGDQSGQSGNLTLTQFTGLAMGSPGISYSGLSALNINLGAGADTFNIQSTASGTTTIVNTGGGNDTVNVQAISAATVVNAATGNDTINVSSNAPTNTGILAGVRGLLTINGGTGSTTANISDSSDSGNSVFGLTGTTLTSSTGGFGSGGSITYGALANLNVQLGSKQNTITVAGNGAATLTSITTNSSNTGPDAVNVVSTTNPLVINDATGNDTNNVQSIGAVVTINGKTGGADITNVSSNAPTNTGNLAGIAKVLTINGGGGTSTANVSDASDASNSVFRLTGTSLTSTLGGFGAGGSISYGTLANLNIQLGSKQNTLTVAGNGATALTTVTTNSSTTGPDTIFVNSTTNPLVINDATANDIDNVVSIGAVATVYGKSGGADIINVSSNAPTNTGNLAGINALLTINGGNGTSTANINDTGDRSGTSSTLSNSALTSTAFGPSGSIAYGSLANLNILLGSGGDQITITSTAVATTTFVNSGSGVDTVNVNATSGPTTVNTGAGSNTNVVNIGSKAPLAGSIVDNIQGALTIIGAGADTMNVDDTGSAAAQTGALTASTLTGLSMGPSGVTYSGVSLLNVSLGSGGTTQNSFNVNVASGQNLPATTNLNGGSSGKDILTASWIRDFNNTLNILSFATTAVTIGNNLNGSMTDRNPGTISSIAIGGSLTGSGVLTVLNAGDPAKPTSPTGLLGSIGTMTVGGSISGLVQVSGDITTLDIGLPNTSTTGGVNDLSGHVTVGGQLTTASIAGNIWGSLQETLTTNLLYIGGSLLQGGSVSAINTVNAALANINTLTLVKDLAGSLTVSGTLATATIGGSLTTSGVVTVGNLTSMTIQGDLAGQLTVPQILSSLVVHGGTPGVIVAGKIGAISVYAGYGPVAAQINEAGVQRRIEAAVPSAAFPTPLPPPNPTPAVSPTTITFRYLYEGLVSPAVEGLNPSTNLANPQLTARVSNSTGSIFPDQFDFSLVTYSDTAKFNLARLDATGNSGISGIRNVAVEGDILSKVTVAAASFFGLGSTAGGVSLPKDNLAAVAVRDFVPSQSIAAKSIQALAVGSLSPNNRLETGAAANSSEVMGLLVSGTTIVQGGSSNGTTTETYRVPFADLATQQVGFFLADNQGGNQFDSNGVDFVVQSVATANSSGTGNVVTPSNAPRGSVIALITVVETFDQNSRLQNSVIESINLRGDGGSFHTQQQFGITNNNHAAAPFNLAITSTGPLGDINLQGTLPSITTPSIFGTFPTNVQITAASIIQTTGQRTDPITSLTFTVPADIGRVYVTTVNGSPVLTTTQILANGPGFGGQIYCGGNLISQVISNGNDTGLIVIDPAPGETGAGNLGTTFTYPSGKVVALGGVTSNGPMTTPAIATQAGTTNITGTYQGGSITTYGTVIANININGPMVAPSVTTTNGSVLNIHGTVQGGFITTYGAVLGNITISGPIMEPILSASNGSVIAIDGAVQGGYIITGLSVVGNISIGGQVIGPMITASNNGSIIINTAMVEGGFISTYGSVTGNVSVSGPITGPNLSASTNSSIYNQSGLIQGGFITTQGSITGILSVGGALTGPVAMASNGGAAITLNGQLLGGSITTYGSIVSPLTINGPVTGPSVVGSNGGVVKGSVAVKGGSILTGGNIGNLTIGGPLFGEVVTIGNMNGTVTIKGPIQGGLLTTAGLINGNVSIGGPLIGGDIESVGNINGNISISGPLQAGHIASLGSILGNLTVGDMDSWSAVVAGGSIGGSSGKFSAQNIYGIVAAVGTINPGQIASTNRALDYQQKDTADAAVIDSIFSQGLSTPLSATDLFDHTALLRSGEPQSNGRQFEFRDGKKWQAAVINAAMRSVLLACSGGGDS